MRIVLLFLPSGDGRMYLSTYLLTGVRVVLALGAEWDGTVNGKLWDWCEGSRRGTVSGGEGLLEKGVGGGIGVGELGSIDMWAE